MPRLQICEWYAWQRFLITHVVPDAERVTVTPGLELSSSTRLSGPAMIHVNLSRPRTVFPDYERWLAAYEDIGLPVLNGYCPSIDKWAVQDACAAAGLPQVRAAREGDPGEALVIKSRANHCGSFEQKLPPELVGDMWPPPWPYPERVHALSREEVSDAIWDDPRIAVERHISNPEGRFQRAYVAGDYVAVATSSSPGLVKEMDQRGRVELVSTTAAAARPLDPRDSLSVAFHLAREMRADFAAIDLALDDAGIAHPIDLNTTPAWGLETDLNPRLIAELSDAFRPLTERGSRYAPAHA